MNGPMMVGLSASTLANQIPELGEYVCVDGSKGGGGPPQGGRNRLESSRHARYRLPE